MNSLCFFKKDNIITPFTNGDFDGWRIYFKNGKYSIITDSVIDAGAIKVTLDKIDPSDYNSADQLFICPDVEEVIIRFRNNIANDTINLYDEEVAFPVNTPKCLLKILVPSATGVISLRTLAELISDAGLVTIADTQTITGAKTFNNSLLVQSGSNPVFRIATTDNIATVNFRNVFNEDAATIQMSTPSTELALSTNVSNYDIRIQPHGTGKIKLPNVPTGTGQLLGRDASNNLVVMTSAGEVEQDVATSGTLNNVTLNSDTTIISFSAASTVTGITGGTQGRKIYIRNESASNITLSHESASSTDVNRFFFYATVNFTLPIGAISQWIYLDSRWRVIGEIL